MRQRLSYGLGSYFMLPEQGMQQYDVLSRGSLFLVKSNKKRKQYHLVSAAHITHPFCFPKLYPGENHQWLSFVTEEDTRHQLQVHQWDTGEILKSFRISSTTYKHPRLDLIVLHLKNENKFLEYMNANEEPVIALDLEEKTPATQLQLVGHNLVSTPNGEVLVPTSLAGNVNVMTQTRLLLRTSTPSTMGLCGGPALLLQDGNFSTRCVGMVEGLAIRKKSGVVNAPELLERIENNTVVISAKEIRKMLDEIELFFDDE